MAVTRKTNLLSGHSLIREGAAFIGSHIAAGDPSGSGMAKCECGAMSPMIKNRAQRKAWHRDHKDNIRAGGSGEVGA